MLTTQDINKELFLDEITRIKPLLNLRKLSRILDLHHNTVSNYVHGKFTHGNAQTMVDILREAKAMVSEIKKQLLESGI